MLPYDTPHSLTSHYPGNTPLVRINSLSDALGVEILGKAEVGISSKGLHASERFLVFKPWWER